MAKRTPRDETLIEIDLLEHLAFKGFVCPDGIAVKAVLDGWVIEPERDLTAELIDDLTDDESPLRHPDDDEDRICVTGVDAVDAYVREAEKDLL